MAEFIAAASIDEVPPGGSKVVAIGDREIALFNIRGTFYAIDNVCPHQGGPLAEGWLDGTIVTCPWHAWCFDVATGRMTLGDFARVDAFEVQVEGSIISISSEPRT